MRCVLVMLVLGVVSANAGWKLNPSLPTPSDVTPNIKTANLGYLHAFYTLSDGDPHLVLGFDGSYAQVWDVGLSNGIGHLVTLTNNAPAPQGQIQGSAMVTYSNTLLLFNKSTENSAWSYDPSSGIVTRIGTNTGQVYSTCRSPDGSIFMGTYGRPRVDEYNPSNGVFRTWGELDDETVGVGDYTYTIAASEGYIYAVYREEPAWWLTIIDRSSSNKVQWWKGEAEQAWVYDNLDGTASLYIRTNEGGISYWMLTNGTPSSIGSLPSHYDSTYEDPQINRDVSNFDTETGYELLIPGGPISVDDSAATATLGWRKTNDVDWTWISQTNGWLPAANPTLNTVDTWPDGDLFWISSGYGPVGKFTPGGACSVLGTFKGESNRDWYKVSASEVYLAGYHMTTLRWNPDNAWTFTPSTADKTASTNNPYICDDEGGKYHCFMVLGSNGVLYTAMHYARSAEGGGVGSYDRTTGALDVVRDGFTDATNSPTDMKGAVGNSKLLYCDWGGKIRVYDVATMTEDTNFTLSGTSPMHKVVEYSTGNLMGVSGTNIYGFTTSGELLWSNNVPSSPFTGTTAYTTHYTRLTLGPDGYAWIPSGTALYRVNPTDGSYTNVMTITTGPNKMCWDGGTAYLYGGTKVWQLSNLLLATRGANSSTLRIGTIARP